MSGSPLERDEESDEVRRMKHWEVWPYRHRVVTALIVTAATLLWFATLLASMTTLTFENGGTVVWSDWYFVAGTAVWLAAEWCHYQRWCKALQQAGIAERDVEP